MCIVAIKEVNSVVTCGNDGKTTHAFSVRNSMDGRIRINAKVAVNAPRRGVMTGVRGPLRTCSGARR